MKLEWAVLGGSALIAGAVLATNHYEMTKLQDGGVFRLNRLTGEVAVCSPSIANKTGTVPPWQQEAPEFRKFFTICEP